MGTIIQGGAKLEGKHISIATEEAKKLIEDRRDGIIVPLETCWPKLNKALVGGFEWGTMSTIGGLSGKNSKFGMIFVL